MMYMHKSSTTHGQVVNERRNLNQKHHEKSVYID